MFCGNQSDRETELWLVFLENFLVHFKEVRVYGRLVKRRHERSREVGGVSVFRTFMCSSSVYRQSTLFRCWNSFRKTDKNPYLLQFKLQHNEIKKQVSEL